MLKKKQKQNSTKLRFSCTFANPTETPCWPPQSPGPATRVLNHFSQNKLPAREAFDCPQRCRGAIPAAPTPGPCYPGTLSFSSKKITGERGIRLPLNAVEAPYRPPQPPGPAARVLVIFNIATNRINPEKKKKFLFFLAGPEVACWPPGRPGGTSPGT